MGLGEGRKRFGFMGDMRKVEVQRGDLSKGERYL